MLRRELGKGRPGNVMRATRSWPGILKQQLRVFKQLRFRLTFFYVTLFSLLLVGMVFFFREDARQEMDSEARAALEEEWGAAKGYLHIENAKPVWVADSTDPEEAYIVERLRHVFLLTDAKGAVLERSETYQSIGIDSPREVARVLKLPKPEIHQRRDANGVPYLIKVGALQGNKGRQYFLAIGRSVEITERTLQNITRKYTLRLLMGIALAAILGWLLAMRALQPLNSVAKTAQEITSSNLSVQIPRRGAGDELDNLIHSFNRMTSRLNHSFEQIRQFSTDVSHELRTPLTAIRGQLEVALFTAKTQEQYRDAMVNALEDVEKLSSIVRALLLLSQAESGQLALQRSTLDLTEVARDIVDQFQIPAEEKQLQLVAQLDPPALAYVDQTQMERMFSNLLSNAIKYTPQGGSVYVRVGHDPESGELRICVEDSGVGIPATHLPHIFDRFYRVRNPLTNKIQGLGLGLSFVAWIVSAHDGTITAESTEGAGTRFTIHFPAAEPVPVPAEHHPPAASVTA